MQAQQLHGFEKDINRLIDAFALQDIAHGCASFATFKKLFQSAGYAYLHQACPGCEHSPEYTQLLYATALDRLVAPSPTVPENSLLWRLHAGSASRQTDTAVYNAPTCGIVEAAATGTVAVAGGHTDAIRPNTLATIQTSQQQCSATPMSDTDMHLQSTSGCIVQQQLHQQQYMQQAVPQPLGPNVVSLHSWQSQQPPQPVTSDGLQQPLLQTFQPQQSQGPQQQALSGHQGADQLQPQEQQESQQQHQQRALPAAQGDTFGSADVHVGEDDFLGDLLAILEEADMSNGPDDGTDLPATAAAVSAVLPNSSTTLQHTAQQPPMVPKAVVPLAVKAAVVFTLHCLYHSQLNQPRVCVYLPLAHLKALQQAATEFSIAGAAATDALLVLQCLLSQQQLVVGMFRRPILWPHSLAPQMQHTDRPLLLGPILTTATSASATEWRAAAVAAAARIARSSVRSVNPHYRQDSGEHREALFHLKSTLANFSNYKVLQGLCDEYSYARKAVFEPLLRLRERLQRCPTATTPTAATQAGPQQSEAQEQQEQWLQKPQEDRIGVAAGTSTAGVPELFDRSFGSGLCELINSEAAHMLMLLDPAFEASKLRKRRQQQQPQQQAANHDFEANYSQGGHQGNSGKRHKKLATADADEARWQSRYLADMAAAGILQPRELQEIHEQGAEDIAAVKGLGIPRHLLRLQLERRQRAMQVASEWFNAQDAMMAHQDDEAEDMP